MEFAETFDNTISIFGVMLMGGFGLGLSWLTFKGSEKRGSEGSRNPGASMGQNLHRDLERLFDDISKGLRSLAATSRFGGMGLMRENQEEVARLLAELQRRLRMLEDRIGQKYEARTHRLLAQAARFGITLPPP